MAKLQLTANDFPILLFFSQTDQCWIADVPDIRHCSAFADSPEEAVREVRIAIDLSLESLRHLNRPVPRPRFGAATRRSYMATRIAA